MACLTPIWHQKPETARRVKQRIAAVMKWCIAQGFREDNPADERITAALGSNTQRPQHMKALHHSHQNRRGHRCSLGNHRRVQVPNPHRHPQRRSKKLNMGRNRPCHRNLDNPTRTHQNRNRAPGSTQHRCSGSSRNSTPKVRRPRSPLPIPDRTDPQQHHHEQTLQREQHRLCATRDAKLISRLVRRNRSSPRSRRTGPRTRVWRVVLCFTRSGGMCGKGVSTTFGG